MAFGNPDFLQTKLYSAKALRAMLGDTQLQAGVLTPTDLKVVQRALGGAGMAVDVPAGAAWVAGTGTRQGKYHAYNDALATLAIASNASGNPRVDQVILRIYDTTDGAAVQDIAAVEILQGTPTAGTQVNNPFTPANYRLGAAALPSSSIRLADILVANGAASITNANIQDRRPSATGWVWSESNTAGNLANWTGTFTVGTTKRLEIGSTLVRGWVSGLIRGDSAPNYALQLAVREEAVPKVIAGWEVNTQGAKDYVSASGIFTVTPGLHDYELVCVGVGALGNTVYRNASQPVVWGVEELVGRFIP